MYYFSYGSNMSIRRLLERISSAKKLGTATLHGHELKFHKISETDNTAKCDAFETSDPDHKVIGVVFEIHSNEKPVLDKFEGLGHGYEEKYVHVEMEEGNLIEVFTYYAIKIDTALKPFHWYKEHVLIGAQENGLPETYIRKIESVESIDDHDEERHEMELIIYR